MQMNAPKTFWRLEIEKIERLIHNRIQMNPLNLLAQTGEAPAAPEYRPGSYWFPEQASTFASDLDWLYYFIYWICIFFFALIIGVMVYFVIKYRRREGVDPQPSPSHNTTLEIMWSVLPSILLIFMFKWGADGYFDMRVPFDDAQQIAVKASQFSWVFEYEDGDVVNELHLVVNTPYELQMESADVIHSFFIPAFRQKMDIVPGRYSTCWVKPIKTGTFRLYCTEFCGDNHSQMKTNVHVHQTEEQRKAATQFLWDENEKKGRPDLNGARLYSLHCAGCHNVAGSEVKVGPNFNGIYDTEEEIAGGSPVTVDANYIRESILTPEAKIVEGFQNKQAMQSFQGKLNDDQIRWIVAYIKSLKDTE